MEITDNARYFYAMTQGAGLAVLMVIFVPLHFGTDEVRTLQHKAALPQPFSTSAMSRYLKVFQHTCFTRIK